MLEVIFRTLRAFPQYKTEELLYEIPLIQVFAMYSWAYANDGWHQFSGVYMPDGGYTGQEAESLLNELKQLKLKQQQ